MLSTSKSCTRILICINSGWIPMSIWAHVYGTRSGQQETQSFFRSGALNSAGGPCAASFAAVASIIIVANCEQWKLKLAVPVYLESWRPSVYAKFVLERICILKRIGQVTRINSLKTKLCMYAGPPSVHYLTGISWTPFNLYSIITFKTISLVYNSEAVGSTIAEKL